ncbi:MAG: dTDP-4-dehydrorhamnose 3,5-epimerase [Alphaproteobacteria bacterium]|nr:dTDP-4-dehydrorhamnose 3,5-epimerase [Alphaproteobacteria bacterium]
MTLQVTPDPVLPEIIHIRPARHGDARGWFSEVYNEALFERAGIKARFVQDNQSLSEHAGTVRGLHFQAPPSAQAKLVRCLRGRIFDVAVDIRAGSPTFGHYTAFEIAAETGAQVYIPEGFAHGFCTLEPATEIAYKVSRYYDRQYDFGIAFDDPALGIVWPFAADQLTLSARDRIHPRLAEAPPHFTFAVGGA